MTGIVGIPTLKLEFAPTDGAATTSPTWVDITSYFRVGDEWSATRGRTDEDDEAQPGLLDVVLNNPSGRFTPGRSATYVPLNLRVPIRLSIHDGSGYVVVWTGLVDEWSPGWHGKQPICRVGASDRLTLLQEQTLKHWETHQHLKTSPSLLWPLTESDDAVNVGEVATGGTGNTLDIVQYGTGGTFEVGVGALPVDDGTVGVFTPVDASNGVGLTGAITAQSHATGVCNFSALVKCDAQPSSVFDLIVAALFDGYVQGPYLAVNSAGKPVAGVSRYLAAPVTVVGATAITDGQWHQLGLGITVSGATATLTLYVDGVSAGTTTYTAFLFTLVHAYMGAFTTGNSYSGSVSHVAFWNGTDDTTRFTEAWKAVTGATGETSTARFTRLGEFANVATAVVGTGLSTMGPQKTFGKTVLAAMQEVADAELTPVTANGAGKASLSSRDSLYNAAATLTLTNADVSADTSFGVTADKVVNDVTGTRLGAGQVRVTNPASITQYGTKNVSLDLAVDTDTQLESIVQWRANAFATAQPRTPKLQVDAWVKQATVDFADAIAVDVGSRIDVSNLPAEAPAASLSVTAQGINYSGDTAGVSLTFNTSPLLFTTVWELDSSAFSVLDSTTIPGV